ncbi:MAG TPA: TIM-barrel domain-containing protein, partial [Chroococcales cyanobacterium]
MNPPEPTVEWEEARKVPTRSKVKAGKNIFKGTQSVDSLQLSGVSILRLSVSPEKGKAPPRSFAVTWQEQGAGPSDQDSADEVEWPSDFDEVDELGREERRKTEQQNADYAAEFENLIEEKGWQPAADAKLPLSFRFAQTKESRWELFFDLPEGAQCLGLGERHSGLNLRGRSHVLFNCDDSTHVPSINAMYKSVPFLLVSINGECYGIFLDSPAFQRWNLDDDLSGEASIELLSRRGWQLYLIGPSSLSAVLAAYTGLTGRHKLPPIWALGHHQSRWSYPDQETAIRIAYEFRSREIPCDSIVLDIDYMDEYRVFTYSKERFADFASLIADLERNNFKVITIVDPGVKKESKYFIFADGEKHDYFCKKADGKLFTGKVWPGQAAMPDFLREDVRKWWAAQHGFHTENGVAGIWNDMNEPALFENPKPISESANELPAASEQLFMQQTAEGTVGHFEVRNVYGQQMSRATYQ